ncbi:TPA: tetratricopeptide repeat protein [Candidatus Micrarchaeota archaeon]|nr:tetratricopeptide repeat protein [Candidatus Micrarchaeota archaeon]HIH30217.1 tetratricopeptide repeat protein [Candidatus Micrarchaeota archaeon]
MAEKPSPTDARTYYHRGNTYYEKGDYERAVEAYNTAIILNPTFSEAYFNRGLCYYNLKNFDRAITDYTKSCDLDPKNPVIYNNRGDAYYRKQDFNASIEDYDRALAINPKYLKAFYNRGLAYACLQDYEKAVEDFTEVIKLNPNFSEAYHIRGLAYDYLNQLDKAIADYDKAIELNPQFTEAVNHREIAKGKLSGGGGSGTMAVGEAAQNQGINAAKLLTKPAMKFTEVAGMKKMKEEINESIVYPLIKPDLARTYGKLAGGGIMLYGPPGCGKTFIMKAAAGECNSAFINAKISDILDMYVGNTEKNLHNIFETARKNPPCIVFFDEVEALGGRREDMQQSTQYMKIAVNQMLFEMDGVESNNENVLVVGATNAPWDVDPALRRSGRFGKSIFIPEPDTTSRADILKLHVKKVPAVHGITYYRISLATIGYASADLKSIVEEAAAIPWRDAFKTGKQRAVTSEDFITAIKKKKSSLPPWYAQANKQIGSQEEKTVVDGKEHIKITESKLAAAEKEAFKELLDVIKKRNSIINKMWVWLVRHIGLYVPIPF